MAQREINYKIGFTTDKTTINDLKKELQSLRNLSGQDLINIGSASSLTDAKTKIDSIKTSVTQVEAALNKAFNANLGTVNLTKFNNELSKLNMKKIASDFSKMGVSGQNAFRTLTTDVLTTNMQLKEANKWVAKMSETMGNTIKWGISSSIMNSFSGSVQKAYGYVKNLDSSLNNIRIVSGQSADQMAEFAKQANNAAKSLGSTTLDYTDAALIYYQQGLGEDQVRQMTDITLKMANVTKDGAEDVSSYMTAIWNNFKDGSHTLEEYADIITALGAATASSSAEIAEGLEKFASVGNTVGLSYEYATSALATVVAQTRQSADTVGTAFKTLFARIQDLELGDTLDDGTTLGTYSEALMKVGINIKDQQGELRDMNDILDEMGSKWSTLSKDQQVSLAQSVAGVRQYTQLVALMDNYGEFQKNVGIASNSTGELAKQQSIYLQSTEAHLNKLETAAQRIYSDLIDSDGLNSLIDIFAGLTTGVGNYIEAIGGSKNVFLQLGAIATKVFGKQISQSLATTISNLKIAKENAKQLDAQFVTFQKFKDIGITDESYNTILKMVDAEQTYISTMSEEQKQYADNLIATRNELANQRAEWESNTNAAEEFYARTVGENKTIDLSQAISPESGQDINSQLDSVINEYQSKVNNVKNEFGKALKDNSTDVIAEYLSSGENFIDSKILKEGTKELEKLKKAYAEYNKLLESGEPGVYTDEQLDAIEKIKDAYGEAANTALKETEKVKTTINKNVEAIGEGYTTAIEKADSDFQTFIDKMRTQEIINGFTQMTSQVMMVGSAIGSIGRLPSIWGDENLSGGEKILQTVMAVANAAQGLGQTFSLVHTAAETLSAVFLRQDAVIISNKASLDSRTESIKDSRIESKRATSAEKDHEKEIEKVADKLGDKGPSDSYQAELTETGKNLTAVGNLLNSNTQIIKENVKAINEQTKAYIMARAARTNLSEEDKVIGLLQDADDVFNTDSLDKIKNKKIDTKGILKKADEEYQQITVKEETPLFTMPSGQETFIKPTTEQINAEKKRIEDKQKQDNKLKEKQLEAEKKFKVQQEKINNPKSGGSNKGTGLFGGLKQDVSKLGSVLKAIPPQAYIAAAGVAALGVAIYAGIKLYNKDADAAKKAAEEAQKASEQFDQAKQSYDKAISTIQDYTSARDALSSLTEGTDA